MKTISQIMEDLNYDTMLNIAAEMAMRDRKAAAEQASRDRAADERARLGYYRMGYYLAQRQAKPQ